MYVEEGNIWYINLFIIVIVLFCIAAFMVIYNLRGGKYLSLQGPPTLTGPRMPCNDTTECISGLSCVSTSLGNMCLAKPGSPCNSLYECDNESTICNGRCVYQKGDVGDYCIQQSDCNGILICAGDVGNQRCLLPQGTGVCTNFYDCVPNSVCDAGLCKEGLEPYSVCSNSHQCAGSNNCLNSRCQPIDIAVPGSAGSYCDVETPVCLSGLECQKSVDYNLPNNIGYCVRAQGQIASSCDRFIGCIPVGECLDSNCILPANINDCASEKCSGGYTCVDEKCVGLDNSPCNTGDECQGGTCGNQSINSLIYGGSGNIYSWSELYSAPNSDLLSMYETIASNSVYQNVGMWYSTSSANLTIYQPNDKIQASFSFMTPSSFTVENISGIKIFQGNNIIFNLSIGNGSQIYSKLVIRNYPLLTSFTNIINLSTSECQPYNDITDITFFTYDYIGNYLYFVNNYTSIYSLNLNLPDGNVNKVPVKNSASATKITFVVHYTQYFDTSSIYDPNKILIVGYLTQSPSQPQSDGWYLFSSPSDPLNFYFYLRDSDITSIPQVALSFSTSNIITDYQFFYYNQTGYFYVQVVPTGNTIYPVAGYIGQHVNIIQSLAVSNLMIASTSTCG